VLGIDSLVSILNLLCFFEQLFFPSCPFLIMLFFLFKAKSVGIFEVGYIVFANSVDSNLLQTVGLILDILGIKLFLVFLLSSQLLLFDLTEALFLLFQELGLFLFF